MVELAAQLVVPLAIATLIGFACAWLLQRQALQKSCRECMEARRRLAELTAQFQAFRDNEKTMAKPEFRLKAYETELRVLENELETINTKAESYLDLVARAKYRLPTLEDSRKEYDQQITLYHVEIRETKLPPIESMKETILSVEQAMQQLEPVNMRALEEYEHQIERKKKFDDDIGHLNNQKKNLIKLVGDVPQQLSLQFRSLFFFSS